MNTAATTEPTKSGQDKIFYAINAIVSAAALALLTWLLVLRSGEPGSVDVSFLPAVNAAFNAMAAVLIVAGVVAIKNGKRQLHWTLMISAFASSALFLVGYLTYHYIHGDTHYEGPGRGLYLAMLASHVLLSVPVVPMALSAFYFAWRKRFATHKRVTKILTPIWLYVSVTGVLVYVVLHAL